MNFHVRYLVVDDVRVVHGHRLSVSSGFFSLVVLWFVSLCSRLPMFAGTQSSTRTLWYTSYNSHLLLTEKNTHIRKSHPLFFFHIAANEIIPNHLEWDEKHITNEHTSESTNWIPFPVHWLFSLLIGSLALRRSFCRACVWGWKWSWGI